MTTTTLTDEELDVLEDSDQAGDFGPDDGTSYVARLIAEVRARRKRDDELEAIARAATAFVDEQGKYINAHNELTASANFAGEEWQALVAAVWAAGR